jgi:WD40 repeat protein
MLRLQLLRLVLAANVLLLFLPPVLPADRHDDPLPAGAVMRLGSGRFRHVGPVHFVAFSPDGKLLLSSMGDGIYHVWDRATGRLLHRFPGQVLPFFSAPCAFSADSKTIAMVGSNKRIHVWDVASEKEITVLRGPMEAPELIEFSPDGKTAALMAKDQSIRLWDWARDRQLHLYLAERSEDAPNNVGGIAFSPDGKLVVASTDSRIHIWDVVSGKERRARTGLADGAVALAVSPDGKWFVAVGEEGVVLGGPTTGKEGTALKLVSTGDAHALAFSPDGKVLAVISGTKVVLVNPATQKVIRRLASGLSSPTCLAFSPDGKVLAVGGTDQSIHQWDVATGKEIGTQGGHQAALGPITYSPDGKKIATSSDDQTIRLWDAVTGKELHCFRRPWQREGNEQDLTSPFFVGAATPAFTKGGKALAAIWPDGIVCLWDTTTGKELRRAKRGPLGSDAVAFSAKGDILADVDTKGKLRLSDVATGLELRRMKAPKTRPELKNAALGIAALAFAPDGRMLAQGEQFFPFGELSAGLGGGWSSFHTTVGLWETASAKLRGRLPFEGNWQAAPVWRGMGMAGYAFRPGVGSISGFGGMNMMGMGGMGGSVLIPGNPIQRLTFSPDGRQLVILADNGAHLWDLPRKHEVYLFNLAPRLNTFAAAFSPDSKLLALGGEGTFSLWDTAPKQELARVGRPAGTAALTLAAGGGQLGPITALAFSPDGKRLISGAADTTAVVWDVPFLLREGKRRRADPTLKQLEGLWTKLASSDAEKAYGAIWALADAKKAAVPFLAERLRPASKVEKRRIAQLIAELDSKRFGVRQRATKELERLGEIAAPALRKVLEGSPGLELQRRVEQLLPKVTGPLTDPEVLRGLRAVEALERAGTPEARKVLAVLAGGAPQARLTREAQAALERLPSPQR